MSRQMTSACPHCDSTNWNTRTNKAQGRRAKSEHPYYCEDCRRGFDSPLERPIKPATGGGMTAEDVLRGIGVDPEEAME